MPGKTTLSPTPRYPDIVLALDVMSTTPPRFHWFFFIPNMPTAGSSTQTGHGGVKLHAITNGKQGDDKRWSYDRTPLALAASPAVAAAALLGRIPDGRSVDDLDALLRQIPMEVPQVDRDREPAWSCRVWIREALRRMHVSGYIHCEDVDAMEEEMWRYGRETAAKIEDDTFEVAFLVVALHSRALP